MKLTAESQERLDALRKSEDENIKWLIGLLDATMAQNLGLTESVKAYTNKNQSERPTKDSRAAAWNRVKDDTLRRVTDIKLALEQQVQNLEQQVAKLEKELSDRKG